MKLDGDRLRSPDMEQSKQAQQLRSKAAQCRRMASTVPDHREADQLTEMARRCEERAIQLDPVPREATCRDC